MASVVQGTIFLLTVICCYLVQCKVTIQSGGSTYAQVLNLNLASMFTNDHSIPSGM